MDYDTFLSLIADLKIELKKMSQTVVSEISEKEHPSDETDFCSNSTYVCSLLVRFSGLPIRASFEVARGSSSHSRSWLARPI
jgi:hypothetical protein